jgi:hypothetical protein
VDLPIVWAPHEIPDRLSRRFQRPARLGKLETLRLRIQYAVGVQRVILNQTVLPFNSEYDAHELPINDRDSLAYFLVLELDRGRVPGGVEWGRIALMICLDGEET